MTFTLSPILFSRSLVHFLNWACLSFSLSGSSFQHLCWCWGFGDVRGVVCLKEANVMCILNIFCLFLLQAEIPDYLPIQSGEMESILSRIKDSIQDPEGLMVNSSDKSRNALLKASKKVSWGGDRQMKSCMRGQVTTLLIAGRDSKYLILICAERYSCEICEAVVNQLIPDHSIFDQNQTN